MGWRGQNNNQPTANVGSAEAYNQYIVEARSDELLVFAYGESHAGMSASYLGAITDADNNILWVNETRPLPD